MTSYRKKFFAAESIILYLRMLLPGSCKNTVRETLWSDEARTLVDTDRASQTTDRATDEDTEAQSTGAVLPFQLRLPPDCHRLNPGDIVILDNHPARAGAFADVWDGSLDGARVVIKSYRLASTTSPKYPSMVRFYWRFKAFSFPELPSATEALQ